MQKVLILWLLLLLSEINCPPSLTQEFCILCSILKTVSGSLVRLQIGKMLDTSQCMAVFFYKERGRGEREREGERERHLEAASCMHPDQGSNLQMLGVWDDAPTNRATLPPQPGQYTGILHT